MLYPSAELRETDVYEEHPEVHTHSVITTTTTTYEMGESPGDENVVVDVDSSIIQVEDAVAETISEFLENDKVHGDQVSRLDALSLVTLLSKHCIEKQSLYILYETLW